MKVINQYIQELFGLFDSAPTNVKDSTYGEFENYENIFWVGEIDIFPYINLVLFLKYVDKNKLTKKQKMALSQLKTKSKKILDQLNKQCYDYIITKIEITDKIKKQLTYKYLSPHMAPIAISASENIGDFIVYYGTGLNIDYWIVCIISNWKIKLLTINDINNMHIAEEVIDAKSIKKKYTKLNTKSLSTKIKSLKPLSLKVNF